jgi:hypothetical protein
MEDIKQRRHSKFTQFIMQLSGQWNYKLRCNTAQRGRQDIYSYCQSHYESCHLNTKKMSRKIGLIGCEDEMWMELGHKHVH